MVIETFNLTTNRHNFLRLHTQDITAGEIHNDSTLYTL